MRRGAASQPARSERARLRDGLRRNAVARSREYAFVLAFARRRLRDGLGASRPRRGRERDRPGENRAKVRPAQLEAERGPTLYNMRCRTSPRPMPLLGVPIRPPTPACLRFASEGDRPDESLPSSAVRLPFRRGSVEYCLGTEADHEAVYQTLLHVFHGPDREAFLGALSDPAYRPDQRLLVKVDGRVVSHVHLTEREVRYGSRAAADERRDVGRHAARVPRARVRPEPDAAGRRPGRRDRRRRSRR